MDEYGSELFLILSTLIQFDCVGIGHWFVNFNWRDARKAVRVLGLCTTLGVLPSGLHMVMLGQIPKGVSRIPASNRWFNNHCPVVVAL